MPAKKLVQKRKINDDDDYHGKEKYLENYENVVVRTVPDRSLENLKNLAIPSIQQGKPYSFTDNTIPKGYRLKHSNPVNTQKSAEAKNLKQKKVTEIETLKTLTNNLKATLQNQSS